MSSQSIALYQRARVVKRQADDSDAALVARARGGDRKAFAALYRRHVALVNAAVLARVPPVDTPDLVQEVFAAALRRLDTVREPDNIAGFLLGIARRITAGYWRSKRATEPLVDDHVAPDRGADSTTYVNQVLAKIRTLPEPYRVPLILRLVEDMTGPEIAARTGLTPGSVRVNLHRGMTKLREALGEPR